MRSTSFPPPSPCLMSEWCLITMKMMMVVTVMIVLVELCRVTVCEGTCSSRQNFQECVMRWARRSESLLICIVVVVVMMTMTIIMTMIIATVQVLVHHEAGRSIKRARHIPHQRHEPSQLQRADGSAGPCA